MSSHSSFQAAAELGDNEHEEPVTQADLVRQAVAMVREFDLTPEAHLYTHNECVMYEVTEILDNLLDWLEPDDE